MCLKPRRTSGKASENGQRDPMERYRRLMRAETYVTALLIFVMLPFAIVMGACNKDPASADVWTRILVASLLPMVNGMFILAWKSALNECFDPPLGGTVHVNHAERIYLYVLGVTAFVFLPAVIVWATLGGGMADATMGGSIGVALIIPAMNVMGIWTYYLVIKRASTPPRRAPE